MKHRASVLVGVAVALGCLQPACRSGRRAPRPTVLDLTPPLPEPEADEARLLSVELQPGAREPIETAPGVSLESMARRALDGEQSAVVRCYEETLVRSPLARGSLELQLDLSSDGSVTRTHIDQRGEGGFDGALACLREVFRAIRVRDVNPRGRYISRVYTFRNPSVDRIVQTPVVIAAPPRVVRARGRRAVPPPAPPPAPTAPRPGPGVLRWEEIGQGMTDVPALRECAGAVLRRVRRSSAVATLYFTVRADGSVSEARVEATPPTLARALGCAVEATNNLRFRASGIVVNAQVPVTFRR